MAKDGLSELDKMFAKMLEEFPEERRKLVENSGDKMYQKVLNNIDSLIYSQPLTIKKQTSKKQRKRPSKKAKKVKSARNSRFTGNLKSGVTKAVGSGGGYAAVRADYKKAPHTHLIENGHKLVRGGQVVGWVPGKHMYRNALNELANELEQEAEKMIERVVSDFG